jgi:alpha-tubulin suppressor-like RCC1 family protein
VVQFTAVTTGASASPGFTCGLVVDGTAYCWGGDGFGTLGSGSFEGSLEPREVVGGYQWARIAAGAVHACGLTTQGVAHCWGSGDGGELGNGSSGHGSSDNRSAPVPVLTDLRWSYLSSASRATCAIDSAGAAYCWGLTAWGRLGDGTNTHSNVPRIITGGLAWASVGVGVGNGCGITTGGTAHCWGYAGLLAPDGADDCDGTTCALSPLPVPGGVSFAPGSISVDGNHACAIETNGTARCWGYNASGEMGDGTDSPSSTPVVVAGGHAFTQVTTGDGHTCGVTDGGDAVCWGNNGSGHLGTGAYDPANSPQPVTGGFKFVQLSTGQSHTCGVTVQGGVLCWGQNIEGQLGNGAPSSSSPRPVWVRFP